MKEDIMQDKNSMYLVKIEKEDEYDEIFKTPHTCVTNTMKKLDDRESDYFNLNYCQAGTFFYDDDSCFESIYAFGNLMKKEMKKLENRPLGEYYALTKYIIKWLELNEYPYKEEINLYPQFIYDSVQLYTIFEIHKWLIKIRRKKDVIANSYTTTKTDNPELNNVIKLLRDLKTNNPLKFGKTTLKRILFSPKSEEYIELLSECINDFSILTKSKKKLEKFIEATKLFLIDYIKLTIQSRGIDFIVTTQQPIYNFDTTISLVRSANSIMGIAFDKLLLYLTSFETYKKKVCMGKNCTNTIDSGKYCLNTACQNERKNLWRTEKKRSI